jgi:hypothetical protein
MECLVNTKCLTMFKLLLDKERFKERLVGPNCAWSYLRIKRLYKSPGRDPEITYLLYFSFMY